MRTIMKYKLNLKKFLRFTILIVAAVLVILFVYNKFTADTNGNNSGDSKEQTSIENKDANNLKNENDKKSNEVKLVASGDMLYHDIVYWSAKQPDGSYDFSNNYSQIKDFVSSADLALGDFEGTISDEFELSGYPLFNAPKEVVGAIKDAGYDVIDLAHNHILDSRLSGALNTKKLFNKAGMDTIGIKEKEDDQILVKKVNGIKIAILGFSYGYNGMENTLTHEEYRIHMQDLNPEYVKNTIKKAEKIADITVVMPQSGVEYALEPTDEQKTLYRNMVKWGADIIFGGHPHVCEPTEIIEHEGKDKFIIYSMGNLLSNQRLETLDNIWTERGVIIEVNIKKAKEGTVLKSIKPHPTWVLREPNGRSSAITPLYNYQTLLCEDYIKGGSKAGTFSGDTQNRIESAYAEVMNLLNVDEKYLEK